MANRWGNSERFIFLASKITADGDYSHEIKRCLLLGRKALTNLDSILKSRDVTFPTKVDLVSSVQLLSHVRLFATPWTAARLASLVHHQLPEFTQTHVHWVGDAIQPSHLLSFPSPPAFNLSQHQGLFKWVSSSHQVAKVLEFQLQHQSFQRTDLL